MAAITAAAAAGEITLGEAAELVRLVEAFLKAIEASEFDRRLRALEAREMRYDLRRRLEAAEMRAAFLHAIKTLSDEEFTRLWSRCLSGNLEDWSAIRTPGPRPAKYAYVNHLTRLGGSLR